MSTRAWLVAIALLPLAVAGCAAAAAPASSVPSGSALDQQAAVQVAKANVPPDATFVSAQFGPWSAASIATGPVPQSPPNPSELVWVITFTRPFAICQPNGICLSPRPGFSYVVVDAATGKWVTTYGYSPAQ